MFSVVEIVSDRHSYQVHVRAYTVSWWPDGFVLKLNKTNRSRHYKTSSHRYSIYI